MSKKLITVPDYHFIGDGNNGWIQNPGRLKFALETISYGPAETEAKDIISASTRLKGFPYKARLIEKRIADFIQAHLDLEDYLHTPLGDIPVKDENSKIKNMWHLYLMRGRELVDELGKVVHICFNLKQNIGGFNEKKFGSLRKIIGQAQEKVPGLESLIYCLDKHEHTIKNFIDLRNRSKTDNDTITEYPWISENGVASGGVIEELSKELKFDFVDFHVETYATIIDFAKAILGVNSVGNVKL